MGGRLDESGRQRRHVRHARQYEQSGLRVQGETFEMHALPGNKHNLWSIRTQGLQQRRRRRSRSTSPSWISPRESYEFSGSFRRDRQYFDYDLLGNPNIPKGYDSHRAGSTTAALAWPQVNSRR
jgi:hypothetical protein